MNPRDGMWKRHRKLAERERCGATWGQRPYTESDGHVHACKVFKGHVGHHACSCGSGTPREGNLRVGARV